MTTKFLTVRVPEEELKVLENYCKKHQRTKTDVIREFLRSLDREGSFNLTQQP